MGWTCCLCSYACLHEVEARQVIERQNIARNHRCWCSGIYMAVQGTDEGGLLPPHMDIKPLLFPVDNFICIGEWLACYTCCLCLNSAKQSLQTTEPKTMPWLGIGAGCEEVYAQYQVFVHTTQAWSKLSPMHAPDQRFHQQLIQDPQRQLLHAVLLQSLVCSSTIGRPYIQCMDFMAL